MIKKLLTLIMLSGFMSYSHSNTCNAPVFSNVEALQPFFLSSKSSTTQEYTAVRLKRIASVSLPSPFLDINYASSLSFRIPSKDLTLDISYQGAREIEEFEIHNVAPYVFFKTMFESPSGEAQCMYLDAFDVDRQDYRVSISSESGLVVAFGAGEWHRIYILNEKAKNDVVTIVLRTREVKYIYDILKNIRLME